MFGVLSDCLVCCQTVWCVVRLFGVFSDFLVFCQTGWCLLNLLGVLSDCLGGVRLLCFQTFSCVVLQSRRLALTLETVPFWHHHIPLVVHRQNHHMWLFMWILNFKQNSREFFHVNWALKVNTSFTWNSHGDFAHMYNDKRKETGTQMRPYLCQFFGTE